jgi:FKBP-type peptidyl-prolyl cis-trans isomerase 2
MIKNKYITFAAFLLLLFLGMKEYDSEVKSGQIQGNTIEKQVGDTYNKITQIIKEYRAIDKKESSGENWADELGINVKPLLQNQNPSIFAEKAADILQGLLRTQKGMELFERLLLTPPSSDGSVDILGLGRGESIPYFNISRFDKKIGTGAPLECGQRVSFKYSSKLQGTKEIHSMNNDKSEVTRIGDLKYIPGIEYYLIGMRKGGERDVVIPPSQAYGIGSKFFDDNLATKFLLTHIEVVDVLSKEPDFENFSISSEKLGSRTDLIICGDKVEIKYQVFNTKMQPLSKKLSKTIIVGHQDLPIGIIKTIEGMSAGEERRGDIPKHLRKTFDGKKSSFFDNISNIPDDIVVKIYAAQKIEPIDMDSNF